ncbi:penicillin-binding protein activator [Thiohalorhabdus sp.]|uniref:penicillin-binding protein activator n=1 Tax=Thiohalorhabdus sp. TaxID=3094134 RepID=UPI002FC31818
MPFRHCPRPTLLLVALTLAVSGCAPGPEPEPEPKPEPTEAPKGPEALEAAGRFAEAADAYAEQADQASGDKAARRRFHQGRMLALAGRDTDALRALEALEDTERADAAALLRARIHLRHQRYAAADRILQGLVERTGDLAAVPDTIREEALDYRAQSALAQGRPGEAFDALVERHRLLRGDRSEANVARIRYLLRAMPEKVLAQRSEALGDRFPSGYLAFEQIMRRAARQPLMATRGELQDWLQAHSGHELAAIVRQRLKRVQEAPLRLAVLLPLDSNYRPVAEALLRGTLAAYYQSDHGPATGDQGPQATEEGEAAAGIQVAIYDTGGDTQGLERALAEIRDGDYEAVIGPLTPTGAEALTESAPKSLPPTLILNTTRDWSAAAANLFQFGLDPEQEARQVAERAYRNGYRRAGVLYPDTDWGGRMVGAFQERWRELGGTTHAMRAFDPDQTDHSDAIQALLDLDGVTQRRKRLAATLDEDLPEYDKPPRQDDLEFLFLPAETPHARLIKPQLAFYAAGDLPVLASSHVNNPGDSRSDRRDLDGIRFLQLPWFLQPRPEHREAAQALADSYPDQPAGLERLNALGFDAYALMVGAWRRALLLDEPMTEALSRIRLEASTGHLTVTQDGRVQRRLRWAEYSYGNIIPLPGMLTSGSGG